MNAPNRSKVLVAMSGGVDSSVTAALLKERGYDVVGCFMRLGSPDESLDDGSNTCDPRKIKIGHQGCCSINDAADALLVAAKLDIPLYVLNFKRDFGRIIDYFVQEYNAGRTPNPCVRCNDWLKFGKLLDYADSIDAHHIATGHYARIDHTTGKPRLLRGRDRAKDQSYVLFGAKPTRLDRMMLPIGDFEKHDVRAMAQRFDLPVFDKPDSQEICFVPDNDYARLVRQRSPDQVHEGDILDCEGQVVGRHDGHQHFTIGQRRGVGVALGYPIYVTHRDPQGNTVTVGQKPDLLATGLVADQTNWLTTPPAEPLRCQIKIRYNSAPVPGTVQATAADTLAVTFDDPIEAVTPGQAVVCYDGDTVLGGGWIRQATA
jgi:tRNA-specific 2-thiouridylase